MKSALRNAVLFTSVLMLAGSFAAPSAWAEEKSSPTASASPANAEADAKRADIRRLLELTGAAKLGMQMMTQSIGSLQRAMPDVPREFWDDFQASIDLKEVAELAVPAYEKHLSHDDIKELIKFYESPIGKKMISAQPQIMADSMAAGQKWGRALGLKVAKRLKEKGYLKKTTNAAPADKQAQTTDRPGRV